MPIRAATAERRNNKTATAGERQQTEKKATKAGKNIHSQAANEKNASNYNNKHNNGAHIRQTRHATIYDITTQTTSSLCIVCKKCLYVAEELPLHFKRGDEECSSQRAPAHTAQTLLYKRRLLLLALSIRVAPSSDGVDTF